MGKGLKIKIKLWNLVVSKPENDKLGRKTAKNLKFYFSRTKIHIFLAHTKPQVDQIRKENRGKVQ